MPRKTKIEAEKTRRRILASALALFVRKGYERTTFTDVASRLKMTKGAVYWHFKTKESLLVALVEEMLVQFRERLDAKMLDGKLTFMAVAEALIERAEQIVTNPRSAAFFMLLQTQVKWRADSMTETRAQLLAHDSEGPYHCFIRAIEKDIAEGRVRADVNPVALAAVSISVWTGLVRGKIEKFLECDLANTLRKTYEAMWGAIAVGG